MNIKKKEFWAAFSKKILTAIVKFSREHNLFSRVSRTLIDNELSDQADQADHLT